VEDFYATSATCTNRCGFCDRTAHSQRVGALCNAVIRPPDDAIDLSSINSRRLAESSHRIDTAGKRPRRKRNDDKGNVEIDDDKTIGGCCRPR
jgi:hypothetical protein